MRRLFTIFAVFTLSAAGALAQMNLQPVAIVSLTRSEPITVAQLRIEVERIEVQNGRALSMEERRQVLEIMINERLVLQAAERDRVSITARELNDHMEQLRGLLTQNLGRLPTDAEFTQAIWNEFGMSEADYREHIRRQGIIETYLMERKGDIIRNFPLPTDEEISSFYELNRPSFVRPDMVRFKMIQVPYGSTAASRTQAQTLANSLSQEIGRDPVKFDEVVLRSEAPNSGFVAGDAGFLTRSPETQSAVGADFMNVLFSLRHGEVSRIIEGIIGFQILMVTDIFPFRNLGIDDVIQPGDPTTVRQYIYNLIGSDRQQQAIQRASTELITELRSGNPFQINEANLNW
ncbi:MAG: SurA N-terminal domain-containing protein [Treponema sp.]|nr:SurA N-terminal domain-containing protein [Treponema sp.]